MNKQLLSIVVAGIMSLFFLNSIHAEMVQPRRLVDAPTAGVLPRAKYDFESRVYPAGDPTRGCGLTLGIAVGITDRLNIGLSYGGEGLVGRGKNVKFNPMPGFLVKYRIFEENFVIPGIAIGYDHQGFGGIADSAGFQYNGYIYKSPGFYLALSKNYLLFSFIQLGLHGTVNYSLEEYQKVKWPNAYAGFDMAFNEELAIVMEYDLATNVIDPNGKNWALPQHGFLNSGIRWAFGQNFYVEADAKDILEKRERNGKVIGWSRELKLVYYSQF